MKSSGVGEAKREVEAAIVGFYEAGKNKELSELAGFHLRDCFSKFDDSPPYSRQNSETAFVHEQAAFANISDYSYSLDDLRIDVLGEVAVATFYLSYRGMFVNDYSFEGSPVSGKSRVTMVLARTPKGWRIAHEHLSRPPDWAEGKMSGR